MFKASNSVFYEHLLSRTFGHNIRCSYNREFTVLWYAWYELPTVWYYNLRSLGDSDPPLLLFSIRVGGCRRMVNFLYYKKTNLSLLRPSSIYSLLFEVPGIDISCPSTHWNSRLSLSLSRMDEICEKCSTQKVNTKAVVTWSSISRTRAYFHIEDICSHDYVTHKLPASN